MCLKGLVEEFVCCLSCSTATFINPCNTALFSYWSLFFSLSPNSICSRLSQFCVCSHLLQHTLPLRYLSFSFILFLKKKLCERAITETPSFSAPAAKFIRVVFHMFILGFLEGRHICGESKRPGAGAFPLGTVVAA